MRDSDSKRLHDLDDVIDRMYAKPGWAPSWADVERVRQYIGVDQWTKARETASNDYDLAHGVIFHLEDIQGDWRALAPYLEIRCARHDAPAGEPCDYGRGPIILNLLWGADPDENFPLPKEPLVCTHRVLAKHGKLDAAEIFSAVSRSRSLPSGLDREYLPINDEGVTNGKAHCRAQYRDPRPLSAERLIISVGSAWTIQDVRVAGKSLLGPHRDLPGFVFRDDVMGPHLALPVIEQDQWIEIEATRIREDASPRFYGSVIGTRIG